MSGRYAMLIASYEYKDMGLQTLKGPERDVENLARVLTDPYIGNFDVQVLINQPSHVVSGEIDSFFYDRKRDDLLLLYFSGHGIKDQQGGLYFATSNTIRSLLISSAVPAATVNEIMRNSRSRKQVLLLDCCYSGAFAKGMIARSDKTISMPSHFKERGRVVLTASDAMQYAFEEEEITEIGAAGGFFTRAIVQGLETWEADLNRDWQVSIDELYDYVDHCISLVTPNQRPGKWAFDVQGEIVIARHPNPPKTLPSFVMELLVDLNPLSRLAGVVKLEEISQGDDPELSKLAIYELRRLAGEDESSVVCEAAWGVLNDRLIALRPESPPSLPEEYSEAQPPFGISLLENDLPPSDSLDRDLEQRYVLDYLSKPLNDVKSVRFIWWIVGLVGLAVIVLGGLMIVVGLTPEDLLDYLFPTPRLLVEITFPPQDAIVQDVISVRGTITMPSFSHYELRYGVGHLPYAFSDPLVVDQNQHPEANSLLAQFNTRLLENGPYTLRIVAIDISGGSVTRDIHINVNNPRATPAPLATPTTTPPAFGPAPTQPPGGFFPSPTLIPTLTPTWTLTSTWTPYTE